MEQLLAVFTARGSGFGRWFLRRNDSPSGLPAYSRKLSLTQTVFKVNDNPLKHLLYSECHRYDVQLTLA